VNLRSASRKEASVLVIVLWIAFGLVSIALYFGNSMSLEMKAADNRAAGFAADQAIEGAARYVGYILANTPTNGYLPEPGSYSCQAVPVGEAHFWLIGRDTNVNAIGGAELAFGLVDEASKLNLNSAASNVLAAIPGVNQDLVQGILDWRDTNGGSASQTYYALQHPPYQCKASPFETVDELRLVYGGDYDTLVGEDANRNGVLDVNENDNNKNGVLDPGMLEYVTVYSREPNTYSNGTARVNIGTLSGATGPFQQLLQGALGDARAGQVMQSLGLTGGPPGPPNGPPRPPPTVAFRSSLEFFRRSGMTSDEFSKIASAITVTNGNYIQGRVNINTASAAVLGCLPGFYENPGLASTVVSYREQNGDRLTSIGWIVDALGQNNASVLDELQQTDCITTLSYQFTADIAAIGPHGRGYRRARFVFDTTEGTPKIIFRQDLSHLGWALGKEIRQTWLAANTAR
jgi:type II secretory pathway component PulK